MNVWKVDAIIDALALIENAIVTDVQDTSPALLVMKISELINLYPSSSEALASATYWRDLMKKEEYDKVIKAIKNNQLGKDMAGVTSASNLTKYIESRIADANYLVTKAERLNRALTHAMEGYRSILSMEKESAKISNYNV